MRNVFALLRRKTVAQTLVLLVFDSWFVQRLDALGYDS